MGANKSEFNHVGLCVTDMARSRTFYEEALGFTYWWELYPPDEGSALLLQLEQPLDLHAVYLIRDGFVLELLGYRTERLHLWRQRSMAEPGLTHISLTVPDIEVATNRVEQYGGVVLRETNMGAAIMVRDPDGQLIELLAPGAMDGRPERPDMSV
jgi:catechol 2,3-dioxygenase-like lactoylglutathione lyase family enzyme